MKKTLLVVLAIFYLALSATAASAATSCTTRKSGSVSITSCSNMYRGGGFSQCRSYKSGSVVKTSCR